MSIANAWLSQGRAVLMVDTANGTGAGGRDWEVSKAFVIPHLFAVVAVRGYYAHFIDAIMRCLAFRGDFDELVGSLPGILEKSSDNVEELFGKIKFAGHAGASVKQFGFVIAGWSPRRFAMAVEDFQRFDEAGEIEHTSLRPGEFLFGPDFEEIKRPARGGVDELAAVAGQQIKLARAQNPGVAIGLRLLTFDLRLQSIAVSQVKGISPL